jgi:hypothetical protein
MAVNAGSYRKAGGGAASLDADSNSINFDRYDFGIGFNNEILSAMSRRTFTLEIVYKLAANPTGASGRLFSIWEENFSAYFDTSGNLILDFDTTGTDAFAQYNSFLTTGSWQSLVIHVDTTNATANDRFKVFKNGSTTEVTPDSRTNMAQNDYVVWDVSVQDQGMVLGQLAGTSMNKTQGLQGQINRFSAFDGGLVAADSIWNSSTSKKEDVSGIGTLALSFDADSDDGGGFITMATPNDFMCGDITSEAP